MVREEDIERLINLTGESNTELWNTLLEDAQEQILAYTNRTSMISVYTSQHEILR